MELLKHLSKYNVVLQNKYQVVSLSLSTYNGQDMKFGYQSIRSGLLKNICENTPLDFPNVFFDFRPPSSLGERQIFKINVGRDWIAFLQMCIIQILYQTIYLYHDPRKVLESL